MTSIPPSTPSARVRRATLIGALAVVLWSTLALLTAATGRVPPLQLMALAFALAASLALGRWLVQGQGVLRHLSWPWRVWLVGVGGLFGYHFLYFLALRHAPVAEASLINYLWPLLIVLFSAALPGERLRWEHVAGALLGLLGTLVLLTEGGRLAIDRAHVFGYGMALACAVTWAGYSVLNRRFASVPSEAVGGFCAATAVLAALCHLAFEETRWPSGATQWLAVMGLGLGPVGAAFYVWDHGCKHGDIRVLAALSYLIPLFSTGLLVLAGEARPSWPLAVACLLIAGGAALAARGLWARGR